MSLHYVTGVHSFNSYTCLIPVTNKDTNEFNRFYKAARESGAVFSVTPSMIELFRENNMEFPWKVRLNFFSK